jgi:hypothetical protein
MIWVLVIALSVVALGWVKMRRRRKAENMVAGR